MTIPGKFKQIVEQFSDRPALVTSKSIISYAELDEKSNQLGNYLIEQGVSAGSVVGIMMDRSVDYILLMLAISKIGGVYAPFDLKQPSARIEQMCKEAKVKFIVTQNNFISKIEGFYEYLLYPDNLDNNKSLLSNSVEMDASDPF